MTPRIETPEPRVRRSSPARERYHADRVKRRAEKRAAPAAAMRAVAAAAAKAA